MTARADNGPLASDGFARPHPRGTLILVLGVASLVFFGVILGPVAFVLATRAIKEIDEAPGAYTNRRFVTVGRFCGAIGGLVALLGIALRFGAI